MAASAHSKFPTRRRLLTVVRLLGGVLLAFLADMAMRAQGSVLDRVLFLAGAVGFFLWALLGEKGLERPWQGRPEEAPFSRRQWGLLGGAVLLGALSWPAFAENRLRLGGLLLLGGALLLVALAAGPSSPPPTDDRRHDLFPPLWQGGLLIAILLLGAAFRLYRLDTLPADMFNDIAHIHMETEKVLNGEWMIYGTVFPGREPLLFYLNALLARFLGLNFLTLKLSTALIGIATLPVIYLLGREAYNDITGLLAALFLAVSKWHVLISRVGFRGILTPLTTALVLYFFLRGLRLGRRADLMWAGAWVGIGLYGYTAALATPLAVLLALPAGLLAGQGHTLYRLRRSFLLAVLVAILVLLPMLRFMLVDGRDQFWLRPRTRVTDAEAALPGPPLQVWLGNLARAAGMFNLKGDVVFRTNIPFEPHLGVVTGALFLLGLALVLVRWRHGSNAPVLLFFLVMILPTTLALAFPQEVPGAVRAGGAMATVMLFPAVAAVATWQTLAGLVKPLRSPQGWAILLAGLALWSGLWNAHRCFVKYPHALPGENYPLYREIARVIDEMSDEGPVLLKSVPFWDDKDAIRLQTREHHNWGLGGEIITAIDPALLQYPDWQQVAVIVNPEQDAAALVELERLFPHGVTLVYRNQAGRPQFAVFVFRPEAGP